MTFRERDWELRKVTGDPERVFLVNDKVYLSKTRTHLPTDNRVLDDDFIDGCIKLSVDDLTAEDLLTASPVFLEYLAKVKK